MGERKFREAFDEETEEINILRNESIEKYGDIIEAQIHYFFDMATKMVEMGKKDDAFDLCMVCMKLSKFTNGLGTEYIYMLGYIINLTLDLNMLDLAEHYCRYGIGITSQAGWEDPEDLNRFLDLKKQIMQKRLELDISDN